MPGYLQPEPEILRRWPVQLAAMCILVDTLLPLQNMRAAGSVPCPSGAWLNHVMVVQVDPLKDNFGVLYEFVSRSTTLQSIFQLLTVMSSV